MKALARGIIGTLLLALGLSVAINPAFAAPDEVVEFHDPSSNVTWRFDLTNLPCENDTVAFFAMMLGVPPSDLQAGKASGADEEGKPYSAAMCFMPYEGNTILIIDENGNGGRVPYDPKPKS